MSAKLRKAESADGYKMLGTSGPPVINGDALAIFNQIDDRERPRFVPISLIPLSLIRDRPSYQRLLRWYRVERIARDFDPRLFGAIRIARYPDGTLGKGPI